MFPPPSCPVLRHFRRSSLEHVWRPGQVPPSPTFQRVADGSPGTGRHLGSPSSHCSELKWCPYKEGQETRPIYTAQTEVFTQPSHSPGRVASRKEVFDVITLCSFLQDLPPAVP